jgi:hypothetical protein
MMVTMQLASATAETSPTTGVRLAGKHHVIAGHGIRLHGRIAPAGGRQLVVTVGGERRTVQAGPDGAFSVDWRPPHAGIYRARAEVPGGPHSRGLRINVYRPAAASYYGPGLYGGVLACGGHLSRGTVGVANKTLPCGAKVTLRYHGKTVTVPVVDRGPYAGNREFDLTAATKARLGFPSTGTVLSTR